MIIHFLTILHSSKQGRRREVHVSQQILNKSLIQIRIEFLLLAAVLFVVIGSERDERIGGCVVVGLVLALGIEQGIARLSLAA